ncbi:MAG: BNR/Asp-box repeat protein [Chloroflexi bacterium ADurb.Bin360]|nr:MAG: BNR/Asp-box repeat protein [Chloroflexi bacterium ADurb.Bin360]
MCAAHRIGIILAVALTLILASLVGGQRDDSAAQAYGICQNGHYFSQDLLIVCTRDGYYRATNDEWEEMPSPDGGHLSVSLAGVIYHYRGASTGIQRSLDSGRTWELVGTFPLTDTSSFGWLSASPITNTIFMGVSYEFPETGPMKGIYKSSDGGVTWNKTLDGYDANEIVFSPNFAQDGTAFTEFGGYKLTYGVWKTTDWGETWVHSSDGLDTGMSRTGFLLSISPQFALDHTVFAIRDILGVYKSIDSGQTWFRVSDLYTSATAQIAISPYYSKDQTLVAGDYDLEHPGLFLSQDGGVSWERLNLPGPPRYVGLRLQAPFQPWPAPFVPSNPHNIHLPFVSTSRAEQFEFWVVTSGSLSDPVSRLYRSCDMGATWEEEWVFERSHRLYLPLVAYAVAGD